MLHVLFAFSLAIVALLYSCVSQTGGTGYVALMALAGFTPAVIKPSALALNIPVSAIGCVRFYRAGLVTWRTCYPFAILGLPFSLIGGALHLPARVYHPVVGTLLLIAGVQMLRPVSGRDGEAHPKGPPFMPSLVAGGCWASFQGPLE
ncbi:sulfite exporter TauE/SafE family protein [Agrobacterium sp. CMT1]|uniref:sulfite exporter TauE/SafE family protein n=1 Tax=Agrobacterium sp. CMT1 TaxID=3128901 RepID=UPI003077772C